MTSEETKEALAHRDALLDIKAILVTKSGKRFFKYLFRELEVGELPEIGLEGSILMDKLGSLRAGRAVFQLVSEANPEVAGAILAKINEEEHARIYREYSDRQSAED